MGLIELKYFSLLDHIGKDGILTIFIYIYMAQFKQVSSQYDIHQNNFSSLIYTKILLFCNFGMILLFYTLILLFHTLFLCLVFVL